MDYSSGHKPKITPQHKEKMRGILLENPDLTLEELKEKLAIDLLFRQFITL